MTCRIIQEQVRYQIVNALSIPDTLPDAPCNRRIIFVAHGLSTELRCFEHLGLVLEWMPVVTDIVNIVKLASDVFGPDGSLERLLDTLETTLKRGPKGAADQLQCAGNETNYTL